MKIRGDSSPLKTAASPAPGQRLLITGVFVLITIVYWWERSRGPGWGDSIAFLLSSLEGFSWSVNATGHFLYDNLNVFLVRLIPWVDPVTLLTAVSILFALLTLVRIYQTARLLTENSFAALLAMIGFAFSFTFWRQVEQVEVYTCASFLTVYAISVILADTHRGTSRHIVQAGCWMGLAILVHIQTVLLIPLYAVYLVRAWGDKRRQVALSVSAVAVSVLILSVPAALLADYTVNSVFLGFGFREEVFHISISSILTGIVVSIACALYSFHIHVFAIAYGFMRSRKNAPRVFTLVLVGIVPVWLFAMRYPVSDQYVFFINAYLFLAIISAYGYDALTALVTGRRGRAVLLAAALAASPIAYETTLRIATHIPRLKGFHQQKTYKGGLEYYLWPGLRTIPDFPTIFLKQQETGIPPENIERELWDRLYNNAKEYYTLLEKHM